MSSEVLRGKESSNRIELSRLVQELLNFGVLGSLWLWGVGVWGCRSGGATTHVHMHAHACTHAHTHVKKLQMAANMFIMIVVSSPSSPSFPCCPHHPHVIPTSFLSSPHHPPTPIKSPTHPHPVGPQISKNSITLEQIEIF